MLFSSMRHSFVEFVQKNMVAGVDRACAVWERVTADVAVSGCSGWHALKAGWPNEDDRNN